ncbi:MAG: hypothetical protein AAF414_04040 [Pseudomonadota bacterium]
MNSVDSDPSPSEQAPPLATRLRRQAFRWIGGAALSALPATALAQTADAGTDDPLFGSLAAMLIAAISLVVIAWQRRVARRETMRADHFLGRSRMLEAVLDSAPWPHFGWTSDGTAIEDPKFAEALGGPDIATFDDLTASLAPEDGARLTKAFGKLRAKGVPFDLRLRRADRQSLRLVGKRGQSIHVGSNGEPQRVDLIWLVDVDGQEANLD